MASVYSNDLRLEEVGNGEQSGTWGNTTNTNLELIAEAFSLGTEVINTNANSHTTSIADGQTSQGRSIYLKYTGALDSNCTITLGPSSISKMWFIQNSTTDSGSSGPYSIIINQGSTTGSGSKITIPNGQVKCIHTDGIGDNSSVTDAFTGLSVPSLFIAGSAAAGIGDVLALSIALG